MKRILGICLLFFAIRWLSSVCADDLLNNNIIFNRSTWLDSEKSVTVDGTNYSITFHYRTDAYLIPATYPARCPHYQSKTAIYRLSVTNRFLVCKPFDSEFTDGKCYEDEPVGLVRRALKVQTDEKSPLAEKASETK